MPADRVNPVAVQVTKEKGIDLLQNVPEMLTNQIIEKADLVVTRDVRSRRCALARS
jgi:protein-tyrosine-phosphatase